MLHGTYHFGCKRVACRNAYCTSCRAPRFSEGRRSLVVLRLWFIPILPVAVVTRWFCSVCQNELDAKRPSRPWILVAGAAMGLLIAFVGTLMLIEGKEKESGAGCLVFGLLTVAGLTYLIRKQDYSAYVSSQETVPPLAGDHCPYCRGPVLSAMVPPRCRSCQVDIWTR